MNYEAIDFIRHKYHNNDNNKTKDKPFTNSFKKRCVVLFHCWHS